MRWSFHPVRSSEWWHAVWGGDGSVRVVEEATRVDEGRRARYAASSKMGVPPNSKMFWAFRKHQGQSRNSKGRPQKLRSAKSFGALR